MTFGLGRCQQARAERAARPRLSPVPARCLIPALESSRRMLAVELQGHGRTGSGDQAASFEGQPEITTQS